MNRENKRKQYKKDITKYMFGNDSFTCKVCDRLVVPMGAVSEHRNQ